MKIKDHISISVLGLLLSAFCLLCFAASAFADWQSLAAMAPSEPQGNEITFRNRRGTVVITVLASDLVRVRMTQGSSPGPDYSYAVEKTDWPRITPDFSSGNNSRVIRTPELEVRVQLSPFRLAPDLERCGQPGNELGRRAGSLLEVDAAGRTVLRVGGEEYSARQARPFLRDVEHRSGRIRRLE